MEKDIEGPIYVYYQLDNFYQNHRRYVKSRDNDQLAGMYKTVDQLASCDPIIKVRDLWQYQQKSMNGKVWTTEAELDQPAIPCGLVAKSFFNDTFVLKKVGDTNPVTINHDNIAWSSDIQYKFNNIEGAIPGGSDLTYKDVQW